MPRLLNTDIMFDPMNFIRVFVMILFSLAVIFAVFTHFDAKSAYEMESAT